MHCPLALFLTVVAVAATRGVTAFVPTHVDYFTETELEALAAASTSAYQHDGGVPHDAGAVVAGLRRGRGLGLDDYEKKPDDYDDDSNMVEASDVGGAEDGAVPDELSPETEELFAAAAAGEDDNAVNNVDDGLTFDPPILFKQYSSDTCDEDAVIYSGSIDGITMLEEGVFCIHEKWLGPDGIDHYTRLTNTNCTVFGVFDSYVDCTDSACEDCFDDDDDYYLGLTTWDQVFPQEFEQHCFQQEFATYDIATETYSMETTFNIDYDFALESSAAALDYKKYIAVHSCIADFVSSDDVTFTSDSVTVTDAETGDSVTVTEDSVTATDADGSSIEIISTDDATLDVVLSNPEGQSMTVEDATVIMTDDGGVIVENDDQLVATNSDGNWVIVTDDSITYGNDVAFLMVTTDGTNFVQFGSTDGVGYYDLTIGGLEVDVSDTGVITLLSSDHAMTFESDYITVSSLNGGNPANITEVEYNFTKNLNDYSAPFGAEYDAALEDIPFFIITGTIDGVCDTVLIAIGANVTLVAAPECGFLAAETDDGYVVMTDDSLWAGNSEGSFFLNDDALTISDADGNTVVTADVTSNPDDDDSIIIQNDNFYFAGSEAVGGAIFVTEGMIVVGTEDAFMVFEDDNVTFGSLTYDLVGNVPINVMTGDNFTLPAEVEINAETGITVTTDDGTMTFTNEYTVILEDSNGDVTINDVTYNYTQDAFVIMGYFRSDGGLGCDIFFAFNLDGFVVGSEECDFLFGAKADDDGATDADDDNDIGDDDPPFTNADDDNESDDDNDDDGLIVPCGTLAEWCASGADDDDALGLGRSSFDIFCGLLPIADPDGILDSQPEITGFIPTDEAFVALYDLLATAGLELDDSLITELIMFHFTDGLITTDDLECGGLIEMMAGGYSRTKCGNKDDGSGIIYYIQKGGGNRKNDIEPFLIGPDIIAENCATPNVMHIIDQVMLPNFVDALM